MSVPASLEDGADHEQMARAQRAHEPSMEEILASIRAIIADEREQAAPKSGPQIVYSADAPRPTPEATAPTVVWSRETEETAALAEPDELSSPSPADTVAEAAPAPAPEAEPMTPPPPREPFRSPVRPSPLAAEKRAADAAALLSGATERAVSQSFQSLAERMSAHGVEVAAGLAREMMQPLLKAWLDENLPGIVDRLVKAELERLTKGWG